MDSLRAWCGEQNLGIGVFLEPIIKVDEFRFGNRRECVALPGSADGIECTVFSRIPDRFGLAVEEDKRSIHRVAGGSEVTFNAILVVAAVNYSQGYEGSPSDREVGIAESVVDEFVSIHDADRIGPRLAFGEDADDTLRRIA